VPRRSRSSEATWGSAFHPVVDFLLARVDQYWDVRADSVKPGMPSIRATRPARSMSKPFSGGPVSLAPLQAGITIEEQAGGIRPQPTFHAPQLWI
jgi:hypothetical protein